METRDLKKVIWGLFLVGIGVLFLLEQTGVVEPLGTWWPLIFVVIAITSLVERRFGGAIMFLLLGAWFFAVTRGWNGMTYGNSWGLVLVAVGVGIVVKALTGEERRPRSTVAGPDAGPGAAEERS